MKKNNLYIADNEIDLRDLIIKIWKKKTLILSISIIFGLAGYFYTLLKPQEFKAEILLKNPPAQIFEPYNLLRGNYTNTNNVIVGQFISDFKLNFLSLDNLQSFIEESREFDNFKRHLKSENISAKDYFANKIGEVKDSNITIANKYFLNYTKELNGLLFLNKYAEFVKKKTIVDFKSVLKLSLLNNCLVTIKE
jgi:LPS O-antigen subunit length determinant protein (WzzB/FepE family)